MRAEGRPLPETAERRPLDTDGVPETNSPRTTIRHASDTAAVLETSDERDQWQAVALAREREAFDRGYRAGHEDGWREGYEARYAELEQAWHEAAHHVAHGDPRSFAELERRRRDAA